MKRLAGHKQRRAAINKRRGWHYRNPARQEWRDAVPARVLVGWDQFGDLVREDIEGRPRRKVSIRPTMLGPLVVTPIEIRTVIAKSRQFGFDEMRKAWFDAAREEGKG